MKKAVFLILFFVFSLILFADVYKYTDKKGRVYFVDSIYQVPMNYRKNMEILPSGKDINEQEKTFARLLLEKKETIKIGDMYYHFLLSKTRILFIVVFLLLLLIIGLIIHFKDFFWALNLLLVFFLFFEGVYIFGFYPEVKNATVIYSYLTKRYCSKKISIPERVKKYSLENAVSKNPIPFNPFLYYKKVERLKDFYNQISFEGKVGSGR